MQNRELHWPRADRVRARVLAASLLSVAVAMLTIVGISPAVAAGPVGSVSPAILTFPQTMLGTSTARSVTLTNVGDSPLTVFLVRVGLPGYSGPFSVGTDGCSGQVLAPGQACLVEVIFRPTQFGSISAQLAFEDDDPWSPHRVTLWGESWTESGATGSLSTTVFDFGTVGTFVESPAQTVTLTSTGSKSLFVRSAFLTGRNQVDYDLSQDGCTHEWLAPGDSCQISVTFYPTASGQRVAWLEIWTSDIHTPHTVFLFGVGAPAVLSVSPASLDLGEQEVGTEGAPQSVTVTNTGLGRTYLYGRVTGTDFRESTCGGWLEPGGSCEVRVWFRPQDLGHRSGTLELRYASSSTPLKVPLTGTGIRTAWLNLKGPGNLFTTGDGSKATLAVAPGYRANYQIKVVNDGATHRYFRIHYTNSQSPAEVQMSYKTGLAQHALKPAGSSSFWTPLVPAGASQVITVAVTPSANSQAVSGVALSLEGANEFILDRVVTETNVRPPTRGTDAYGLFVKENSQPFVGGSMNGQTATAPSTPVGGTQRFTANLRNDSKVRETVWFSLAAPANPCWASTVTVKEGTKTVDITSRAFGDGYARSIAGYGTTVPITITATRLADDCTARTYTARTHGDGVAGHTSYLLVNPNV